MGRFTKRLIGGLAAALALAGGAVAQTSSLDNFEDGNNRNQFGDYWFFFDDGKEKSAFTSISTPGNSSIHSAEKSGDELLFKPNLSIVTPGANGSSRAAVLDFTWGRTFLTAYNNSSAETARNPTFTDSAAMAGSSCFGAAGNYKCGSYYFQQFVGIGTNLVADGETEAPKGFENATALTFWAKGEGEAKAVWVFFQQSDIGAGVKDGAHYGMWVELSSEWTKHTVPLEVSPCSKVVATSKDSICVADGKIRQPQWVGNADLVADFDKKKIVKVQFQIQISDGASPTEAYAAAAQMGNSNSMRGPETVGGEGKFYIDDIAFEGFTFVAPDMCNSCVTSNFTPGASAIQLDGFATGDNQNSVGQYWYFYDDTKTDTDDGVKGTSTMGIEPEEKDCNSPYVDVTKGECEAKIQTGGFLSGTFGLGQSINVDGESVDPFVGIGTNLYDEKSASPTYYNADGTVKGVSFEYNTAEFGASKITFEVQDEYDADGSRPVAAVYYIDLPVTNGTWYTAVIPFDVLVQHTGWQVVKDWNATAGTKKALKTTALAKLQWKVQDGSGFEGVLQIKNVNLLDASNVGIKFVGRQAKAAGLRATYNRGVVGVNWSAAQNIASGKVSLVNVKGRTIATAPLVKTGGKVTANLGKGTIPTGMYFVRINAKDVQGKKVVQQVPLSVVK